MQSHTQFEQLDVTGASELTGPHFRRSRIKLSFARLRPVSPYSRVQNLLQHTIFEPDNDQMNSAIGPSTKCKEGRRLHPGGEKS
jgi:hypothetical protein